MFAWIWLCDCDKISMMKILNPKSWKETLIYIINDDALIKKKAWWIKVMGLMMPWNKEGLMIYRMILVDRVSRTDT